MPKPTTVRENYTIRNQPTNYKKLYAEATYSISDIDKLENITRRQLCTNTQNIAPSIISVL